MPAPTPRGKARRVPAGTPLRIGRRLIDAGGLPGGRAVVDIGGKLTACHAIRWSGNRDPDGAARDLLARRACFVPALAPDGRAVPSVRARGSYRSSADTECVAPAQPRRRRAQSSGAIVTRSPSSAAPNGIWHDRREVASR